MINKVDRPRSNSESSLLHGEESLTGFGQISVPYVLDLQIEPICS